MKKNGFTLVELLAVIVILAIVSSIVMISVNSTLSNSKESLFETQKKEIEEAAEIFYLKEGMNYDETCPSVFELVGKGYIEGNSVKDPKTNEDMDGYVKINYESNKYSYTYQTDSCKLCKITSDVNGNKKADVGDIVTCDTESFYIVNGLTNNSDTISMLAKYNLNINQNIQLTHEYGNGIAFSQSTYWYDTENSQYKPGYSVGGNAYNENSNLYDYVEEYELYLQELGIIDASATLMSKTQANNLGCSGSGCSKSFMNLTSYWLGDLYGPDTLYVIAQNGILGYTGYANSGGGTGGFGIRPVITMSKYEI